MLSQNQLTTNTDIQSSIQEAQSFLLQHFDLFRKYPPTDLSEANLQTLQKTASLCHSLGALIDNTVIKAKHMTNSHDNDINTALSMISCGVEPDVPYSCERLLKRFHSYLPSPLYRENKKPVDSGRTFGLWLAVDMQKQLNELGLTASLGIIKDNDPKITFRPVKKEQAPEPDKEQEQ